MIGWLISRAMRTPYTHLEGYMERFWLVPVKDDIGEGSGPVSFWRRPFSWLLQRFGIAIRLHHILRSDEGRDPHDHPWSYLTIILRGGYVEKRYNNNGTLISATWHGPGSVLIRPANSWHMLKLTDNETTWTMFVTSRYAQGWGFLTTEGKVPHREYKQERGLTQ